MACGALLEDVQELGGIGGVAAEVVHEVEGDGVVLGADGVVVRAEVRFEAADALGAVPAALAGAGGDALDAADEAFFVREGVGDAGRAARTERGVGGVGVGFELNEVVAASAAHADLGGEDGPVVAEAWPAPELGCA